MVFWTLDWPSKYQQLIPYSGRSCLFMCLWFIPWPWYHCKYLVQPGLFRRQRKLSLQNTRPACGRAGVQVPSWPRIFFHMKILDWVGSVYKIHIFLLFWYTMLVSFSIFKFLSMLRGYYKPNQKRSTFCVLS